MGDKEAEHQAAGLKFPAFPLADVLVAVIPRTQHASAVLHRTKVDVRVASSAISVQFDDVVVNEGLEVGLVVLHQALEGLPESLAPPDRFFEAGVHFAILGKEVYQRFNLELPDMMGVAPGQVTNRFLVDEIAECREGFRGIHGGII